MTEFILLVVILALLAFVVWNEWRHEKHIKELEDKIKAGNITEYYQARGEKITPPANPILKVDENEVMLNEIPFLEIPKDFKIEHEGSPETPSEAVARKGE